MLIFAGKLCLWGRNINLSQQQKKEGEGSQKTLLTKPIGIANRGGHLGKGKG